MSRILQISRVTGNHQMRDLLKDVLARHADRLSPREAEFIRDLTRGSYPLSDRQWAAAARLVEQHLGWTIKEA